MSDVTSSCTVIHQAHMSGMNCAIFDCSSCTAADYIDINDLLETNLLGKRVKYVHSADSTEDPYGTAVKRPVVLTTGSTTISDRITVGTGPSSAEVRFIVFYE